MAEPRHDVGTIGESLLRLSVPRGERLERMASLDVSIGGAESNVATAVARMGFRSAWVSRLPRSPLGRRAERTIFAQGVDTSGVVWVDEGRMGTYFIEFAAEPRRIEVVYDRARSTATELAAAEIPWEFLLDTRFVHLTGITPGLSETCRDLVVEVCTRARDAGVPISLDVNYRAKLWTPAAAAETLLPLMRMAQVVICGHKDAVTLFDLQGEPETVLFDLRALADAPVVVLTQGSAGALAVAEDGSTLFQPALRCEVVDRIGAGDAFSAGVLCGMLEGSLSRGLRYGTAMAAHKLTTFGDMLVATREEVLALLEQEGDGRPSR